MKNSLLIGRLAGIRIFLHWTFLLLLSFIVLAEVRRGSSTGTVLASAGFVLALFACVVLHELGHSLMARRFGIGTRSITLLPIGGITAPERIPEKPRQELLVALAGPTLNVLLALVLYLFVAPVGAFEGIGLSHGTVGPGFLTALFWVNVMLVVFNAIPAFPMDGGRVLLALLALRLGRPKATAIAAGLGKLIAVGFVFYGLFNSPFLVFIGIFVYFGAYAENVTVQHRELLRDFTVGHAMITNYLTLAPTDSVQDAANTLLAGSDQDLIVLGQGKAVGVLTRPLLMAALRGNCLTTAVAEVMSREFDTVEISDSLAKVYARAQRQPNAFYPVLENHRLRGIIDQGNLTEFLTIRAALSH
ncbi:site-2 protease family protein [Hymenobacter nivis]|uniref:Zinc metalloprotease n=1 Tax=Hymenobacter nivis TaxID=1850093 RepID=A0A2Z3GLE2_9BACT|nr:site-2 protease family protein [Hymenobacter nivis]AWM31715.1 site-2 protease family protein [Hymenobacter nivis]